jgi:hypothetical protein
MALNNRGDLTVTSTATPNEQPTRASATPPADRPSTAIRAWRIGLVVFGLALLAISLVVFANDVNPKRYFGVLTWFAGAIILHDGLLAPIVFGVSLLFRRLGTRVSPVIIAIVQGAIVVGGIVGLLFIPEVLKKSIGTLSTSILPLNYALNLVIFYGVLAVVTVAVIVGYAKLFASRQKLRPSADQD